MDIKEMALWAIEWLASSEGEPSTELLGNIYAISHAVLGECSADHSDWIKLTKEIFAEGALDGYCPSGRKHREELDKNIAKLLHHEPTKRPLPIKHPDTIRKGR